ncbi:DUF2577 domain-containing protein [Clostridium sp. DJ247]|uniref:DUF2577 domain-containing protein n=1 Tax=Clostridium sp. DJ247 TaxID=2726188 RepID=UPI001627C9C0|nr:DUF2577 domain-containing protein [Clostridium sp. DJ247]MBC2579688.1 DUF2577 domain-containing protein [Clostridium sp. DJ247]
MDAYNKILNIMENHGLKYNPPSIDIGIVISESPLTIKIEELQLTKDNVLVADFLLPNCKRKINIPNTTAAGSITSGSITSISIPEGELNFTDGLKKNDIIACLATEDRQKYIILARLVKP